MFMYSNRRNNRENPEQNEHHFETLKRQGGPLHQLLHSLAKEQQYLTNLLEAEVSKTFYCLRHHNDFNELLTVSDKIEETMKLVIKKEEIINKILKTIAVLNAQQNEDK